MEPLLGFHRTLYRPSVRLPIWLSLDMNWASDWASIGLPSDSRLDLYWTSTSGRRGESVANHYRTVWRISGELVLRMPWGSSVGGGTLGLYEQSIHWGVRIVVMALSGGSRAGHPPRCSRSRNIPGQSSRQLARLGRDLQRKVTLDEWGW